jgi:hypothetical protein
MLWLKMYIIRDEQIKEGITSVGAEVGAMEEALPKARTW